MRYANWVAPTLLVWVGATQIALTRTADLSPWLGGGFGMFSNIDSRSARHLVVLAESPGLWLEREVPEELSEAEERVRALPTQTRLRAFAERMLRVERERVPDLRRLRVQLWRTTFAPGTLAPNVRLVRDVDLDLETPDG